LLTVRLLQPWRPQSDYRYSWSAVPAAV